MVEEQNQAPSVGTSNSNITPAQTPAQTPAGQETINQPQKKNSKATQALDSAKKTIGPVRNYIANSALFKIATSPAVANTLTTTLAILTAVGVAASPLSPIVVGTLSGLALAGVAIKVGGKMIQARNLRHLEKENNLLVDNRNAIVQQGSILDNNIVLKTTLQAQLLKPELMREGKKSVTERLVKNRPKDEVIAEGIGKSLLTHGLDIGLAIVNTVATSGAALVMEIGSIAQNVFALGAETSAIVNIDTLQQGFKEQIDSERKKSDTPGYNNIRELKAQEREQRIQTKALDKLVNDKDYPTMSKDPEAVQKKFDEIKADIEATEKSTTTSRNIFARAAKLTFSVFKDTVRGQSPYSNLNDPSQVVINKAGVENPPPQEKSQPKKITEALKRESSQLAEKIRAKITTPSPSGPNMSTPYVKPKLGSSRGVG